MKLFYKIFTLLLGTISLCCEPIDTLNFGNYYIGFNPEVHFIKSVDTNQFKIVTIKMSKNVALAERSDSDGKLSVVLQLETKQNLQYSGYAFVNVMDKNSNQFTFPIFLKAEPHYNDNYDSYTYNLKDTFLINALRNEMNSKYVSFTYSEAREKMFSYVDNYDGFVECIYTGRKLQTNTIPDVNTTHFNTEHTWAQTYGAKSEPEKSDLFHLRPTYEAANSARASYPFGYVIGTPTYSDSGCYLGVGNKGFVVFEARDKVKGDIARSLFYFALKYGNISSVDMSFLEKQYEDMYQWQAKDTVDTIEMERNSRIEESQKIRNPFIDHPEFIDRFNLIGNYIENMSIINSDDSLKFCFIGNLNTYFFSNKTTNLEYANISGSGAGQYSLKINDSTIDANSIYYISVTNSAISQASSTAVLKVKFVNSEEFNINLSSSKSLGINEKEKESILSIFPNPVTNNRLNIKINNENLLNCNYELVVYDINAKEIFKDANILYSNIINLPLEAISKSGREFLLTLKINGNTYSEKFIIK
jgi:deoxyribonuclease I